jgi:hypothetical protein
MNARARCSGRLRGRIVFGGVSLPRAEPGARLYGAPSRAGLRPRFSVEVIPSPIAQGLASEGAPYSASPGLGPGYDGGAYVNGGRAGGRYNTGHAPRGLA